MGRNGNQVQKGGAEYTPTTPTPNMTGVTPISTGIYVCVSRRVLRESSRFPDPAPQQCGWDYSAPSAPSTGATVISQFGNLSAIAFIIGSKPTDSMTSSREKGLFTVETPPR